MGTHSDSVTAQFLLVAFASLAAGPVLAAPGAPLVARRAAPALPGAPRSHQPFSPSLRAAYVQSRQKEAGTEYAVATRGAQVAATNPAHHLAMTMDAQGVHLQTSDAAQLGSLHLVRAGCAERPTSLAAVPPQGKGTRVEYQRPGLTEWYVNGPLGLEQGFTVTSDPGCARLGLELQLGAEWSAKLVGTGNQSRIELAGHGQRVYYSDLFARDAQNHELATKLLLIGQTIRLEVDTTAAHYPVEVDPLLWTQQLLTPADGTAEDFAGNAVAVSGNTALVGVNGKTINGEYGRGQVYVYGRTGNTWTEQQKLIASDGAGADFFGSAIAMFGDTAIIGAPNKQVGTNPNQGQAYVFTRTGATWTERQKLTTSNGAEDDNFGIQIAMTGDIAVFGCEDKTVGTNKSQGMAYVFARTGTTWAEQQILLLADGAGYDRFGVAAVSGDTVVIGARGKDVSKPEQGQVYVYTRTGTTWIEQQKLTASDSADNDRFGHAVAINGNTLLAGAPNREIGGNMYQGQVYVYTRTGTTWTEQQKLTSSDGAADDHFGKSLAIDGNTAVLATYEKFDGTLESQGQAYLFTRQGSTWTEQQKLHTMAASSTEYYGFSMALDGTTLIVGAPFSAINNNDSQGAAYVYFLPLNKNGDKCALGTECMSGACSDGVCCSSACGGGVKTDCQSCVAAESGGVDGTCAPIAAVMQATCRAAAGGCDRAELCDGTSTTCPSDQLQPMGMVCQAAANTSQLDAVCSGTSAACPANLPAYQFSGGGLSGCTAAVPLGVAGTPGAAGAAWALTALFLLAAARRRAVGSRASAQ